MKEKRVIDGEFLEAFHGQLEYGEEIMVRDIVDGIPGRYRLIDLSVEKRMNHIAEWIENRVIPLRSVAC
jgi:hypothetical protein